MSVPRHIAIIPDGNRRYATAKGRPAWDGHKSGVEVFRKLEGWCKKTGVEEVSFWAASTENLERDKKEVDFLLKLFSDMCDELIKNHSSGKAGNVRIKFVGCMKRLPEKLQAKMTKVEELTKNNTEYKLNLLVAYGGREELVQAAKSIAIKAVAKKIDPNKIDEKVFARHLYLDSDPDLVIRTSQQRLSGLLPFQTVYSEIIFLEKLFWPEFSEKNFNECIAEYANRKRTFGH